MFDAEDGRTADDVFGMEYTLSGNSEGNDPAAKAHD